MCKLATDYMARMSASRALRTDMSVIEQWQGLLKGKTNKQQQQQNIVIAYLKERKERETERERETHTDLSMYHYSAALFLICHHIIIFHVLHYCIKSITGPNMNMSSVIQSIIYFKPRATQYQMMRYFILSSFVLPLLYDLLQKKEAHPKAQSREYSMENMRQK